MRKKDWKELAVPSSPTLRVISGLRKVEHCPFKNVIVAQIVLHIWIKVKVMSSNLMISHLRKNEWATLLVQTIIHIRDQYLWHMYSITVFKSWLRTKDFERDLFSSKYETLIFRKITSNAITHIQGKHDRAYLSLAIVSKYINVLQLQALLTKL